MEQLTEYRAQAEAFLQSSVLPVFVNAKMEVQQAYEKKIAGTHLESFQFSQITPFFILQVVLGGIVSRFVVLAIYRLYFHPLRNFPGPFLARTSNIYSLYYDWWLGGKYSEHLRLKLHPKYGPIVRSRPDILRFSDPDAFNKINCIGYTFVRDPSQYKALNMEGTSFGSDPKVHRSCRQKTAGLFSKTRLLDAEPLVHEKVDLFLEKVKMRIERDKGETRLDVHSAMLALVFDIVQDFLCDGVGTFKLLENDDAPSFHVEISDMLMYAVRFAHWDRHFPKASIFLQNHMPARIQLWLTPYRKHFATMNARFYSAILHWANLIETGTVKKDKSSKKLIAHLELIPAFKDNLILYSFESQVLTQAGTNTTAYVLAYLLYELASNPALQTQARAEISRLKTLTGSKLDYTTLQTSELLTSLVKESTRLSNPVPFALPRLLPKTVKAPVEISGSIIPPGTTCEMSSGQLLLSESIYGPNPEKFNHTRWLSSHNDAATLARRNKYFVPFGAGSYVCLGMWMAYMELYVATARILESGLWWELTEELREERSRGGWVARDELVAYKVGVEPVLRVSVKE